MNGGRVQVSRRILCVLAATLIQFGVLKSAHCAEARAVEDGQDFEAFLVTRDLVVDGTVTAIDTVERTRIGGCDLPPLGTIRGLDVHVRVGRAIFGTTEDSTIIATVLAIPTFPRGAFGEGSRVILWAFH